MKSIAESRVDHETLDLPAMTICPGLAYKNETKGPFFNNTEFEKNAYNLTDLFETSWFFRKKSKYKIEESRNILNGRCYTIYFLSKYYVFHVHVFIKRFE